MTRAETLLIDREKLSQQYVRDIELIVANLCPEAMAHWEDGSLNVSNAHCLCKHSHEKQQAKLNDAVTKTPSEFVPYNIR